MTPADLQRIKHAQNDLVSLCGGLDKVTAITSYGRSTVGRWADVGDPTLMPTPAIVTLQRHCRLPIITAALAALDNRRLSDPEGEDAEQSVMTSAAEAINRSGEFTSTFAAALADGRLTPNELTDIDRALGRLERAASAGRKALAAARAGGGLKVAS